MSERQFRFNGKVTVFSAACLVLFLNLGFWQLSREEEKRALIVEREARFAEPSIDGAGIDRDGDKLDGLNIFLDGYYLTEYTLLLDNIVLKGQVGFEVLQLFRDYTGRHFLVNRGFVAMGRTRDDPVHIPELELRQVRVVGRIYVGDGAPMSLSDDHGSPEQFPAIIQKVDIERLKSRVNQDIYPYVIRLNEGQHGALPRFWPDTVMPPEKHRGYAIQWFMMALAVTIAWLFFSFPTRREEDI